MGRESWTLLQEKAGEINENGVGNDREQRKEHQDSSPSCSIRKIAPDRCEQRTAQVGDRENDADGDRRVPETIEVDGKDDVQIGEGKRADAARRASSGSPG